MIYKMNEDYIVKKFNKNSVQFTDKNGVSWIKEYDENGNLTYYNNISTGYEETYEYDENNNEIYYKNNEGYEKWIDYNDGLIHSKDVFGYEEWYEYDENNNEIHFKNNRDYEYYKKFIKK